MRLNWILELGGIGLVGAGGLLGRFQNRDRLRGRSRAAMPTASADAETEAKQPKVADAAATTAEPGDLPRIVRPSESDSAGEGRGPAEGFVVRPIRISDGPAVRRARQRRDEEERRDERDGMGPRRLVP